VRAVTEPTERLQRLAQALHEPVKPWRVPPVVEALHALGGVQFTGAGTLVAARGDLPRVEKPRQLLKCLGLTPAAYSTGERRRQGALTQAGHRHARRVLVEGAWAYRYPATVRRHVQLRLEPQPTASQDLRWKAPVRRCTRSRRLMARGQHANQVVVAIARELVGFRWAMAKQVPLTPEGQPTQGE
jgi:transposase